jgi:transposase
MSKKARVFSREFKLGIISRIMAGENVSALGRELKLSRKDLYAWHDRFLAGGPQALRGRGRPRQEPAPAVAASETVSAPPEGPGEDLEAARRRVAELERKIGQQQVELDFFQQALRQVRGARRPNTGAGVTESTRSSKR